MIYFENAKRTIDATNVPFLNGSNVGPGFMIDDAYTMESERARYSEAHDTLTLWVQRKEFAGSYAKRNMHDLLYVLGDEFDRNEFEAFLAYENETDMMVTAYRHEMTVAGF